MNKKTAFYLYDAVTTRLKSIYVSTSLPQTNVTMNMADHNWITATEDLELLALFSPMIDNHHFEAKLLDVELPYCHHLYVYEFYSFFSTQWCHF